MFSDCSAVLSEFCPNILFFRPTIVRFFCFSVRLLSDSPFCRPNPVGLFCLAVRILSVNFCFFPSKTFPILLFCCPNIFRFFCRCCCCPNLLLCRLVPHVSPGLYIPLNRGPFLVFLFVLLIFRASLRRRNRSTIERSKSRGKRTGRATRRQPLPSTV